jgi:pimeloyl-ACP methyl ester carboxylesterase
MITRRLFSSTLAAGAAAVITASAKAQGNASAASSAAPSASAPRIRNVVLVHGLYADGSSWIDVIARLQAAGLRTTAVQNGLLSLDEDVAATRRALARQDGPTVLVGHSFAGMIVSEAGVHPNVASLVYVAARGPDAGEDYAALAARFPKAPASNGIVTTDGFIQLSEQSFLNDFAGDVEPVRARALYAVQQPASTKLLAGRTTVAAWRSKPTWYQVSRNDRTINPELQRFMAARMKATTVELDSSHVSLISHPAEIARIILDAANA